MVEADGEQTRNQVAPTYALRNAVTVISGRAQLLKKRLERGDSRPQVLAQFAALDEAVGRMTKALDDLDAANRPDADG